MTQALSQFFFTLADGAEADSFYGLLETLITAVLLLLNAGVMLFLVVMFCSSHFTAKGAVKSNAHQVIPSPPPHITPMSHVMPGKL